MTLPPGPCPICGEADRPNDGLHPSGSTAGSLATPRVLGRLAWLAARSSEPIADSIEPPAGGWKLNDDGAPPDDDESAAPTSISAGAVMAAIRLGGFSPPMTG